MTQAQRSCTHSMTSRLGSIPVQRVRIFASLTLRHCHSLGRECELQVPHPLTQKRNLEKDGLHIRDTFPLDVGLIQAKTDTDDHIEEPCSPVPRRKHGEHKPSDHLSHMARHFMSKHMTEVHSRRDPPTGPQSNQTVTVARQTDIDRHRQTQTDIDYDSRFSLHCAGVEHIEDLVGHVCERVRLQSN